MSDIYTHRDYSFDDEAMSFALHMDRMTAEKLHSKAEIASELAWRDDRIAELEQELTALREYPFEYGQLEARYDIQKKELTALRELLAEIEFSPIGMSRPPKPEPLYYLAGGTITPSQYERLMELTKRSGGNRQSGESR